MRNVLMMAMGAVVFLAWMAVPSWAAESDGHDRETATHAETEHAGSGHAGHEADAHDERDEDDHEAHAAHGHDEHEEAGVYLTEAQRETVGVRVQPLVEQRIAGLVEAPGEVRLNAYATAKLTPRITAQILRRHSRLGERVEEGAPLVTLSSVEMASAQGELKVAQREWERVRGLGAKVVSERRYTEAQVGYELARARVLSYGMTEAQIAGLLSDERAASGEFDLLAPRAGTVISDDFVEGDVVGPGRVLMTLTDESVLWVEARLMPRQAAEVQVGSAATVSSPHGPLSGRVVQLHHTVEETTRTLGARIEIHNPQDRLHAGEFVVVRLDGPGNERALALPEEAVLRSPDGDWQVFVEVEPGRYEPREVTVSHTTDGLAVLEGLASGTRVVTHGAFFIQSELAKSGFEIHQH